MENPPQPEAFNDSDAVAAEIPSPDRPHWGVLTALGIWIGSIALLIVTQTIAIGGYVAFSGLEFANNAVFVEFARTDPTAIVVQVSATLPAHLLTLALCVLLITAFFHKPFWSSIGWTSGGVRFWHYFVMMTIFFIAAITLVNFFPPGEDDLDRIIKSSTTALYIVGFLAVFSAPLVEEVVYRGVMYPGFLKRMGMPLAVTLTTILFTLVHVPQYYENPVKIALLTLLSFMLTALRAATGSLLPAFILHTLINGTQIALLLAEPLIRRYVETPTP
ncbi:MAG: CPBP family intramembrane metalloprotease [Acidobacteria bacterium]|nr:CPBP family intramembrane metalloprotease [Acidobacteriota bacterium]